MPAYKNETVLVEIDQGVGTVTLNRPEKMNAMNRALGAELDAAIWGLEADESVRAIVVTGAGRAFCAGIDLSAGGDTFGGEQTRERDEGTAHEIVERYSYWKMSTPVIAAINGAAIGAGLTVPLLFDVRYAAEDARLAFPFTRLGIIPEANSTWLLPRLVGVSRALELLLSGRPFSGREAAEIGLVSRALPRDEVLGAALELARGIAENTAPASVAVTKRIVYQELERNDRAAAMARETGAVWWIGQQPDAREGVVAQIERRPPSWKGSKHVKLPDDLA